MNRTVVTGVVAVIAAVVGSLEIAPYVSKQPLYVAALPSVSIPVDAKATVIFGGDMMFDRTVRSTIDRKGGDFIFACIEPFLQNADLVVANLEGPITEHPSRSLGSEIGGPDNYVFTFATSTAALLYTHHIKLVNLGNNHITNFGTDGVRSTMHALSGASVGYFGDPIAHTVAELDVRGVKLGFVNYNEFDASHDAELAISQIRDLHAKGDVVVVYTHWGIEYEETAPAYIQSLAHQFVDAGAAIVVGSHPHVVEQHEQYHGADIYYSLGNFIFDQYWYDAVTHGLMLTVTFTEHGVASISETPIELLRSRQTCPVHS